MSLESERVLSRYLIPTLSVLCCALVVLTSACDGQAVPLEATSSSRGQVPDRLTTTSTSLAPTTTTTAVSVTTTTSEFARPDLIVKLFDAIDQTIAAESGRIQAIRTTFVAGSGGELVIDGQFQSDPPGGVFDIRVDGELVEIAAAMFGAQAQLSQELAREPVVAVIVDEDSAFIRTSVSSSASKPWIRIAVGDATHSLKELGIAVSFGVLQAPHLPVLDVLRSDALVDIGASPLRRVRESRAEGIVAHVAPHAIASEVVSADLWDRLVDAGIEELDLGPPIEVGVWLTNGHIGAVRVDLTDLFARIGELDIAPALMEQLSASVWINLSMEIWDVGAPIAVEYPPASQITDG